MDRMNIDTSLTHINDEFINEAYTPITSSDTVEHIDKISTAKKINIGSYLKYAILAICSFSVLLLVFIGLSSLDNKNNNRNNESTGTSDNGNKLEFESTHIDVSDEFYSEIMDGTYYDSIPWEDRTYPEKIPLITYNGDLYTYLGVTTDYKEILGNIEFIDSECTGYEPIYSEFNKLEEYIEYQEKISIIESSVVNSDAIIGVVFKSEPKNSHMITTDDGEVEVESENIHLYYNFSYKPENLDLFLSDLSIENKSRFIDMFYQYKDGDYTQNLWFDDSLVYNYAKEILFSKRDTKCVAIRSIPNTSEYCAVLRMEYFSAYTEKCNMLILLYDNGYMITNIQGGCRGYYIGQDTVDLFLEKIMKYCTGFAVDNFPKVEF